MTGLVREVDVSEPAWAQFVDSQPTANAFHTPAWTRLLSDCYGYRASALAMADSHGQIVAGLPLLRVRRPLLAEQAISLPFTDSCPPLLGTGETASQLARLLVDWRMHTRPSGVRLLVRSGLPPVAGWVQRQVAVIHTLKLSSDVDKVFRSFKRTQVQQCIIKAERDGVTVRRGESFQDLMVFYKLHTLTRRRLGAPVQPLRFFRLIWERLLAQGTGFVLLAFHGNTPVAGAVFLTGNGTLIYKFSASDQRFWRLRPNNLVLWTAIRWACINGFALLDFGRTDLDNTGLREFKNGWGTTEHALMYSALGPDRGTAPSALTREVRQLLGSTIQRSPPWVCRLAGELLYRYAT
jgi:CelD/BcsL family acetyltransferase involved in cellulose biosynthesis